MTPAFALLASLLVAQDSESVPPSLYDEVHALELTADDPPLIEARGPTAIVELEIGFSGTLHLWTRSELDLFLRVEDAGFGTLLAEDDDSGGGNVPHVRRAVEKGAHLAVMIASSNADALGPLELHLVAAPETAATLEAALAGRQRLEEIRELREAGERVAAREATRTLVQALSNVPGARHSEQVIGMLEGLGLLAEELGDLTSTRAARGLLRNSYERTLPADHPDLLRARENLAITISQQGDLPCARALQEAVLAAHERTLPADHPDLLRARGNLANTMGEMGDLPGARALEEAVLAARERTLPADHPDLLRARGNLANTIWEQGDLPGARALQEAVLAAHERTLPADHPDLLRSRGNLAAMIWQQGDLPGARALQEAVLAAHERALPADHPDLLSARENLANTIWQQGDLPGARALQEAVLAGYERTLPADHPDLLRSRGNLAAMIWEQGDLPGARALQEAVLAAHERALPADHPDLLRARENLAAMIWQQGDLPSARALQEAVLAAHERKLPADHPFLLAARQNLAITMGEMGDLPGARALVGPQVAGTRALVLGSLALAPRQAREAVGGMARRLAGVLFLTRGADPDLQAPVFELQETMRMVAGEAARALRTSEDPAIRSLLAEAGTVRAALGDLVSRPSEEREREGLGGELTRLMQERDRLEREASRLQAERGVVTRAIELGPLARALGEEAALVTYRRIARGYQVEGKGRVEMGSEHLLAHVLWGEGTLVRIDLGEAVELEELVTAWRSAVGAPLLRGLAAEEEEGDRESAAGEALRAKLLDPVLAVLGEDVTRLHVCADDLVYLVPLDALPFEEGRIGDRWSVANEVSCARLVAPSRPSESGQGLLAVGGVDYDAGAENEQSEERTSTTRNSMPDQFSLLLQTRFEAETTGALCEDLLGVEPVVLTRKDTTKAALFEQALGKRYLHLATHGWFAAETLKSTLDEQPGARGWASMGLQERVTGMGPMLLCGLALAGANRPIDSLGRRPGILTAEELCSLDLSSCELAVLSACETNVGIRRAGQGIQSLQAALYAAGARSSITSLWKVDDAATRRLFELFYTKLWEEKKPKAQALWEAKRVLRAEGAPVRDWAAWVLTGDPQ